MKSIVFGFLVLVAQASSAYLQNSTYDARHQSVIRTAIENNCGLYGGVITQTSAMEFPKQIDQGITDVDYVTDFTVQVAVDQYDFDTHTVQVYSSFADMYDHNAQDWGSYSVTSVNCAK